MPLAFSRVFAWTSVSIIALSFMYGFLSNSSVDIHLHDTYFVVAHAHIIFLAGLLMGIFAAVYYIYPRLTGRHMGRYLGWSHWVLTVAGLILIFWPVHYEGVAGMPRRYYDYSAWQSFRDFAYLNQLVSAAVLMVFTGQVLFAVNLLVSIWSGKKYPDR